MLESIKCLTDRNIKVSASFVLGLLGETTATTAETVAFAHRIGQNPLVSTYFSIMMPLPGTVIWEKMSERPDFNLGQTAFLDMEALRRYYLERFTETNYDHLVTVRDEQNQDTNQEYVR